MNKEKTLAAHRLKKTIVEAKQETKKAKTKTTVVEAKMKKVNEAFEVAKDVVEKHKETLKLAKDQILENRELINLYESLLDMKYKQVESLTREVKNLQEAKKVSDDEMEVAKKTDDTLEKCKKLIKIQHKKAEALQRRCEMLQAKLKKVSETKKVVGNSLNERYKHVANFKTRQVETLKRRCKMLEEKLKDMEVKRVKAKVVPADDQCVKKHDAMKAKVEALRKARKLAEQRKVGKRVLRRPARMGETSRITRRTVRMDEASRIARISKLYSRKYGISEAFSKRVLEKLGIKEGTVKIQNLIQRSGKTAKNESRKVIARKPVTKSVKDLATNEQAEKIAKFYNEKFNIPEKAAKNLLSKLPKNEAVAKLQMLANEVTKYAESKKVTESKKPVTESAQSEETSGTSLYSIFM